MNEMRDHSNCGTNTLCAYKHEWPLRAMAGFLQNAEMNDDTQKLWIELDGSEENGAFYLASPCKFSVINRYENNYGQNTAYKSCVKSKWWTFWDGPDKTVDCIKRKAEGYSDYKPNFCYERNGIVQA